MLASNVPDTEKCDGILVLHTDNVRLLVVTEIPLFSTEISPIAVRNSLILFIALAYCCGSFPMQAKINWKSDTDDNGETHHHTVLTSPANKYTFAYLYCTVAKLYTSHIR